MKKTQQTWIEKWDVKPTTAILLLGGLLSWGWWTIDSNIILAAPNFPRYATMALAVLVVIVLQFANLKRKRQGELLRGLTHFAGVTIAFMVFWDFWHWEHLTASDWFRSTTLMTGRTAIAFITLSLACTPLITLFGWSSLNALKKPTGNWGFAFATLHLVMFAFDYGFLNGTIDIQSVVSEAILKQYALVGFLAFLLLVPLAATSNKWSQKKLGKKWKQLHKLVYVIGVLAVAHYIWVWFSKLALAKPLSYAIVMAFLLFLRIPAIKNRIRDFKKARRLAARAAKA